MTVYTVTQIGLRDQQGCEGVFSSLHKAMYHVLKWCRENHESVSMSTDILSGPFPFYMYTDECKWEIEKFTIDEED